MDWKFYIIYNKNCSYAGVSPDVEKRLRKHNGELHGGAKYTCSKGPGWEHICIVEGFPTKINAMQFEWAVKHCAPKKATGINNRMKKLIEVLSKDQWTQNSPLANTIPLIIKWVKTDYKPDNIKLPDYITEAL